MNTDIIDIFNATVALATAHTKTNRAQKAHVAAIVFSLDGSTILASSTCQAGTHAELAAIGKFYRNEREDDPKREPKLEEFAPDEGSEDESSCSSESLTDTLIHPEIECCFEPTRCVGRDSEPCSCSAQPFKLQPSSKGLRDLRTLQDL